MKASELVAALAALEEVTVQVLVQAADHQREADKMLASVEAPPKKRRGRKPKPAPVVVEAPAPTAKKGKTPAKKSSKKSLPDTFFGD